jgi:hypothetical protein
MAFGNSTGDFTIIAPGGTIGEVISISFLNYRLRKVYSVQMKATAGAYSDVVTSEVVESTLYNYLEDTNAPTIAWVQTSTNLYVFLRTSAYPLNVDTNRIGIIFDRNTIPVTSVSSYIDIPQEAKQLFLNILLRNLKQRTEKRVEIDITSKINKEKLVLGLS